MSVLNSKASVHYFLASLSVNPQIAIKSFKEGFLINIINNKIEFLKVLQCITTLIT